MKFRRDFERGKLYPIQRILFPLFKIPGGTSFMNESCDAVTNVVVMIIIMSLTVIAIFKVPAGYV